MRATMAEQEKARRQQEVEHAEQLRAMAQRRRSVMYGPSIDKNFSWTTLNVGYEDRERTQLEVRTDIPEETLMRAIAELYGVGGEMELDVKGLTTIARYDVCSYATYTLYGAETALRRWPKRILRTQFIRTPGDVPVPVVMGYGMREERTTVRKDTTKAGMIARLAEQFREKAEHEWTVRVEDGERTAQTEFQARKAAGRGTTAAHGQRNAEKGAAGATLAISREGGVKIKQIETYHGTRKGQKTSRSLRKCKRRFRELMSGLAKG
jgi:hypothetical protein